MRYLLFALTMCACVHAEPPRQNTQWVVPPTRYGDMTVEGHKEQTPQDNAGSESSESKNSAGDSAKHTKQ